MEPNTTKKIISEAPNKVSTKDLLEKFVFPATLEWQSYVVEATSHEVAEKLYLKNRLPQSVAGNEDAESLSTTKK